MVDFTLEPKHQKIIETTRDFVNRWIVPNRMKYDELCEFPWDIVKAAYDEGFMNGPIPKKFGGSGHSIFEGSLASEELGAGCIGIGICIDGFYLVFSRFFLDRVAPLPEPCEQRHARLLSIPIPTSSLTSGRGPPVVSRANIPFCHKSQNPVFQNFTYEWSELSS